MSGKLSLSMLLLKPRRFSPALIEGLRGQPLKAFGRLRHDRVSGRKSTAKLETPNNKINNNNKINI